MCCRYIYIINLAYGEYFACFESITTVRQKNQEPRTKEEIQNKSKSQRKNSKEKKLKASPNFRDTLRFFNWSFFDPCSFVFFLWFLASWFLNLITTKHSILKYLSTRHYFLCFCIEGGFSTCTYRSVGHNICY